MAGDRLDAHGSKIVRELFDENTAQIGSLGDIVEKHAGDSVSFVHERSIGIDNGESDFEAEMNPSDPSNDWENSDDEFPATDSDGGIGETDITGTAAGIARGFGSHLTQDLGKEGFQIEVIPTQALPFMGKQQPGEELDDYDDEDPSNGKYDSRELLALSEPGLNAERPRADAGA